MVYEIPRRIDAVLQENRTDHGFHGVGEDRGFVTASGALLAATQMNDCAEVELAGDVGQCPGVDDGGTQLGQLTFGQIRIRDEEVLSHNQTEHRVTEKLQTFIGGQATLFVRVRTMRQGAVEQLRIDTHPELGQQFSRGQANCSRL